MSGQPAPTAERPACGAMTKSGEPCQEQPVAGRIRCRLHGGAAGSGAPAGQKNGRYNDGFHTKEAVAERNWVRSVLRGGVDGVGGGKVMDGNDDLRESQTVPSVAPKPRTKARRVRAQVYKVEGTIDYWARPPAGETRAEWIEKLRGALGSSSIAFLEACLHRLLGACTTPGDVMPSSTSVSAALAMIEAMQPDNELQAALAVDAACLHAAATNILSRIRSHDGERRLTYAANAATKLERAFHSAVEVFYKVKRGNVQTIRVEKLVVESGGQAMVGQVVKRTS